MRILSLTQPWATLVALGAKAIETRSWSTTYRGPIAIHAAQGLGPVGGKYGYLEFCTANELVYRALNEAGLVPFTWNVDALMALPFGAIVAVVDLAGCVPTTTARHIGGDDEGWSTEIIGERWPLTPEERAFGDYSPGRYAWLLADVRRLAAPMPYRGAQGLRRVPADVAAELRRLAGLTVPLIPSRAVD